MSIPLVDDLEIQLEIYGRLMDIQVVEDQYDRWGDIRFRFRFIPMIDIQNIIAELIDNVR